MQQPLYILTDIEGTTTPKSFVYDVLFPYFVDHLHQLNSFSSEETYKKAIDFINATLEEENETNLSEVTLENVLKSWVEQDRKHPGLKLLQGLIWEQGYQDGSLKGIVYDDILECLTKWKQAGIQLGVYSSGSVKAQLLLFGHTNVGNLNPFFSHNFDTAVGGKKEMESYIKISKEIGIETKNILFLSDLGEELNAAKEAGMNTIQLIRDRYTEPSEQHIQVNTFKQIEWP